MIVSVAPSPSIDVLYVVPRLQVGTIHRPVDVHRVAGGKGFNVARVACALGRPVVGAAVVGGASGAWIAEQLLAAGLETLLVEGVFETRHSVSVEAQTGAGLTEFYEPATPVTSGEWLALETLIGSRLGEGSWLTISGSLPPGAPPDAVARLLRLAHSRNCRAAVDTYGAALVDALRERPAVVKVNHHEAAEHLGQPDPARGDHGDDEQVLSSAALAGCTLVDAAELAIVTCGTRGAVAVSADGDPTFISLPAVGRYPVGSGDAFLGGLVAALDHALDVNEALRWAAAAGAANAMLPGAGVIDVEQHRELVKQVRLAVTP